MRRTLPPCRTGPSPGRRGFTLLEMLLAITLLTTAFGIAYASFSAATRAWRRGVEVVDALSEGDIVMERLVAALRSAVFFPGEEARYGFRHQSTGGDPPRDSISWVTATSGFLPPDAPLARAPYRMEISLEPEEESEDEGWQLVQRAWQYLIEDPRDDQVDTRVIARFVRGFRVRMFDENGDAWADAWEDEQALPLRVELTLLLNARGAEGGDVVLQRHVEIPIAPFSTAPEPAPRRTRR